MKKVILSAAVALACVSGAVAQKQTGGEKNLEVQFAPLGGSPVSISGIRLRIFNSESTAIRLGINLGGGTTTNVLAQAGETDNDQNSPVLYEYQKHMDISIRPGFEKHFAGTDRLSPYVGAEVLFSIHNESTETEDYNGTNSNTTDRATWTTTVKDGSTTFGLNAVAGVDFYFADNLYLGTELGFGFSSTKQKDTTTEVSDVDRYRHANGLPTDTKVEFKDQANGKTSGWGPNYQATLRLGWLFN